MNSRIEQMSRANAEKLLGVLRTARAQGQIVDVVLTEGSDWVHPTTAERMARADALESCLERMLTSRAGG